MAGLGVVLVLCGPMVSREPVGQGDWSRVTDPVHRRVASTMAGEPVRSGVVAIVPLFARVPSEAGHGWQNAPALASGPASCRLLHEDGRFYLRILNPDARSVFVPAGTVYTAKDGHEVFVARDAVIPGEFAALLPVWTRHGRDAASEDVVFGADGLLAPAATGALLHEAVDFDATVVRSWRRNGKQRSFAAEAGAGGVVTLARQLERAMLRVLPALDRTVVGAVFLIGNRPVGAHVFGTHELFVAALPALCNGVAQDAHVASRRDRGAGVLAHLARFGDARGRSLAFLRGVLRYESEWGESYGEGFDVVLRNDRDGVFGHAVVDHGSRVFHAAFYALGRHAPPRPGGPGGVGPTPPGRPNGGGDETPPGVRNRRPRPSIKEQRQNDRDPRRR